MRLIAFSVTRYRSITSAQKLPLGDLTTLVGPNNEGKSNILRALVMGMRHLGVLGRVPTVRRRRTAMRSTLGGVDAGYSWHRDFPKSLQDQQPNGRTILDFEFELDQHELAAFRAEIKSTLNGYLPIRLMIDREGALEVKIRKQGKGGTALTGKAAEIARFVGMRLRVQYVPSVRTAAAAVQVIDDMVADELQKLEKTPDYQRAVRAIEKAQAPVLAALSSTIHDQLREFLPDVRSVDVTISEEQRFQALRRASHVIVDDGTATDLHLKGDGVQSLAAISLIRRASHESQAQGELVLAIEEPEAHLHPHAIHQLREVLEDIASRQQLVVTTHSPLLTNLANVSSNIIVEANRARSASNIADVRNVLGVRTTDNLESARVVLVLEGETDVRMIRCLLQHRSPSLRSAISAGELALESLAGGANLRYKLAHLREAMCVYHVLLDHDEMGLRAAAVATTEGLLKPADQTFTIVPGMRESEIEDLLNATTYEHALKEHFGVVLVGPQFHSANRKWTQRVKACFELYGQPWNTSREREVKNLVAEAVCGDPEAALHSAKHGPIDAMAAALEEKLRGKPVRTL